MDSQQPRVLIVDDEESVRSQLRWALSKLYDVYLASNADTALDCLRHMSPDIVLLDIALSPHAQAEGLQLLDDILQAGPTTKVIMITGHDSQENAIEAITRGAYDFHSKPVDLEELRIVIKRALHIQALERENQQLRLVASEDLHTTLIGESAPMLAIKDVIASVAATDMTVLIQGESGTGKEVVATEIHRLSRVSGPLITVNCGAIPKELMESELFGHEKGAFTDARGMKRGKLEQANRGTVFLDEIGELSPDSQVKLLRFLQEHDIERVGGLETISLDVRVIAATNQDLEAALVEGRFREDLYYRLNVIDIKLPPLRHRGEDSLLLANAFLGKYNHELSRNVKGFTKKATTAIRQYSWPGNVRELQNRLRRAILLAPGKNLTESSLGLSVSTQVGKSLQQTRDEAELECIQRALETFAGNVSKVAKSLDATRATIYDLLKKHGLDPSNYRNSQ